MNISMQIDATLEHSIALAEHPNGPPLLSSAVRYAVLPGGARVRPQLCMAVAAACEPDAELGDALAAASAIEMLHCASLVHDDMPCFDDADTRRGKPSVHAKFGEPLALLVGDALIVMSFDMIAREVSTDHLRELVLVLTESTAPPHGITAGQAWESESDINLQAYHNAKTAALFVAAARAGAAAVGHADGPWRELGRRLGEAYQIADDLRDVLLSPDELGKPARQDGRHGRPSAVDSFGVEETFQRLTDAIEATAASIPSCAGEQALRQLIYAQAKRLAPESLVQQVA
ncbi:MAG: polyprenyl synthetase family protein [Pseudomonadota bacterium]